MIVSAVSARNLALDPPSDDEIKAQDPSSACTQALSSQGGDKRHGGSALMQKIFRKHSSKDSKTPEMPSPEVTPEIEEESDPGFVFENCIQTAKAQGFINPCTYLKPLDYRMEPRDEIHRPGHKRNSKSSSRSPITIARNRGEANRILTGAISDEGSMASSKIETPLSTEIEEVCWNKIELDPVNSLYLSNVAVAFSSDPQGCNEWKYFLRCYSQGNFNLSSPPPCPNLLPDSTFLPAFYPCHERARMPLSALYGSLWPQWAVGLTCNLVKSATKKFNVPHVSLSFFDDMHEVFTVENGYHVQKIDRATSLAAHVLFSTQVLVILDTTQDWRFKGNPLVTGPPYIRFFAGAPMLASDGQVLGVFSIFDQEPRSQFSPIQQLELAEFTAAAMADVIREADCLSNPEGRMTPLLDRESIINGDYEDRTTKSYVLDQDVASIDYELCPPALRFHKPRKLSKNLSRLFISQNPDLFLPGAENTPPSSGEDVDESSYDNLGHFVNNRQQLLIDSNYHNMPPDSRSFRMSTPRPFSSSDVTSVHPHPPNTPVLFSNEATVPPNFEATIQRFMELSDGDCAEAPEENSLPEDTPFPSPPATDLTITRFIAISPPFQLSSPSSLSQRLTVHSRPDTPSRKSATTSFSYSSPLADLSPPGPPPKSPPPAPPSHQHRASVTVPTPSIGIGSQSTASSFGSIPSNGGHPDMTDAAQECKKTALNLGYGIFYVAEIKAKSPHMTDAELLAPGGCTVKPLAAYGMGTPIILSKELHLSVLRRRGYDLWENPCNAPGQYDYGILLPVHSDTGPVHDLSEGAPARRRNSGFVIGAYHMLPEDGVYKKPGSANIQALIDACASLRDIIAICKRNRRVRKLPKRANTEPNTPCLSDEAAHGIFNKFSLDAGDGRKDRTPSNPEDQLQRFGPLNRRIAIPSRIHFIDALEKKSDALSQWPTIERLNQQSPLPSGHNSNEGFERELSFSSQHQSSEGAKLKSAFLSRYQSNDGLERDSVGSSRYPANAAFKRESATSSRYPASESFDRRSAIASRYAPSKGFSRIPVLSTRYPANEASEVQLPESPVEVEDFSMKHTSSRWR